MTAGRRQRADGHASCGVGCGDYGGDHSPHGQRPPAEAFVAVAAARRGRLWRFCSRCDGGHVSGRHCGSLNSPTLPSSLQPWLKLATDATAPASTSAAGASSLPRPSPPPVPRTPLWGGSGGAGDGAGGHGDGSSGATPRGEQRRRWGRGRPPQAPRKNTAASLPGFPPRDGGDCSPGGLHGSTLASFVGSVFLRKGLGTR